MEKWLCSDDAWSSQWWPVMDRVSISTWTTTSSSSSSQWKSQQRRWGRQKLRYFLFRLHWEMSEECNNIKMKRDRSLYQTVFISTATKNMLGDRKSQMLSVLWLTDYLQVQRDLLATEGEVQLHCMERRDNLVPVPVSWTEEGRKRIQKSGCCKGKRWRKDFALEKL